MLIIPNLHAELDAKPFVKDLSLCVNAGRVHAIMGQNNVDNSTLGYADRRR